MNDDIDLEIYHQAIAITRERGYTKIAVIAGEFNIGYTHAGRILERMITQGIIEPESREIVLSNRKVYGFAVIPEPKSTPPTSGPDISITIDVNPKLLDTYQKLVDKALVYIKAHPESRGDWPTIEESAILGGDPSLTNYLTRSATVAASNIYYNLFYIGSNAKK